MIYIDETKKSQIDSLQYPSLTRRQFKLALLENNLTSLVEQKIAEIEDETTRARILIEYQDADTFERSNVSVQYMLSLFDLTDDQIDQMWTYAASL